MEPMGPGRTLEASKHPDPIITPLGPQSLERKDLSPLRL